MNIIAHSIPRERPASISDTIWAIVRDNIALSNSELVQLCVGAGCNPNTAKTMVSEFRAHLQTRHAVA